jgi:hypothetical protein
MTPDIEKPDPLLLKMHGRNVSRLLPVTEEGSPSSPEQRNGTSIENGFTTSVINDLSIVNEDGSYIDVSSKPITNNAPLNVQGNASDDEIIVLSEEAENIF